MELVNLHSHTLYSHHGEGTVAQVVAAAKKAGITTLALTEHYLLTDTIDPQHENAIQPDELPHYLLEVAQEQAKNPGMTILAGAEFDWLGAAEDRDITLETFAPFTYSLLSVHFIDGWGFDDPANLHRWEEVGVDDMWRAYASAWIDATMSWWPCTAMAHPDLIKKFGYYPSFELGKLYGEMTEALQASGRMTELNAAGAYYPCAQTYPAPELLRQFCRAGIPCTVGTDSHAPEQVDRGLRDAYRGLYEAGYRSITVLTPDGDRRQIPFD